MAKIRGLTRTQNFVIRTSLESARITRRAMGRLWPTSGDGTGVEWSGVQWRKRVVSRTGARWATSYSERTLARSKHARSMNPTIGQMRRCVLRTTWTFSASQSLRITRMLLRVFIDTFAKMRTTWNSAEIRLELLRGGYNYYSTSIQLQFDGRSTAYRTVIKVTVA